MDFAPPYLLTMHPLRRILHPLRADLHPLRADLHPLSFNDMKAKKMSLTYKKARLIILNKIF